MKKLLFGTLAAVAISTTAAHADDIVEIAAEAGTFSTLLAAAEAAGLVDVLKSDGPWTVLAPTDDAFAALPEGTVANLLLPQNKDQLVAILTYHVDDRLLTSDMISDGTIHVKPVNTDALLTVTKSCNGITINGANVIATDIIADNGVIHVIDQVLIPGS